MEQQFKGTETIGQIVSDFPDASNLFKAHNIDFCCGGDRVLAAVLKKQQIEEEPFFEQLNEMFRASKDQAHLETDWREAASGQLIDHIVDTHHAYLVKELPILSEFTTKILRVHGQGHRELAEVHKLFHQMKTELEHHLIAEEEVVFPLIKQYEQSGSQEALNKAVEAIGEAEDEHSAVGDILKQLRKLTDDYTLPAEACRTYTLTFQKLEELESDLFQHIHLENNILFKRLSR